MKIYKSKEGYALTAFAGDMVKSSSEFKYKKGDDPMTSGKILPLRLGEETVIIAGDASVCIGSNCGPKGDPVYLDPGEKVTIKLLNHGSEREFAEIDVFGGGYMVARRRL